MVTAPKSQAVEQAGPPEAPSTPPVAYVHPSFFYESSLLPLPISLTLAPYSMSPRYVAVRRNHHDEQAQAASLKQELATAKQEGSGAVAAARSAEQQLLLASSQAAAAPNAADTATAALTAAAAAAAATIAGSSGGEAETASTASATDLPGGVQTGAVVGGGVGLEIEKGSSSDALRLEELKAELQELQVELQAATAAKKKVGRTTATMDGDKTPTMQCTQSRSNLDIYFLKNSRFRAWEDYFITVE